MSDHRTILATVATINFLQKQPGEFTPAEIRNLGKGFHSDNDESDVLAVCRVLAFESQPRLVKVVEDAGYEAFRWKH